MREGYVIHHAATGAWNVIGCSDTDGPVGIFGSAPGADLGEDAARRTVLLGLRDLGGQELGMWSLDPSTLKPVRPDMGRAGDRETAFGCSHDGSCFGWEVGAKVAVPLVPLSIPIDFLADHICAGVEGGIRYWCSRVDVELGDQKVPGADPLTLKYGYLEPFRGGALVFTVSDDGDGDARTHKKFRMDRAAVERGARVIVERYPHHAGALFGHNFDATTGDVLIQCSIFGDIVYG